jgi:predicted RNA-binding protein with PUA-like domain
MASKPAKVHRQDTAKKGEKRYWLMKSEPDVFSIDDLKKNKTTLWEGVRNYQARNHLMEMQAGDEILFYHSSAEVIGVAGIGVISKTAVPDPAQFDKKSEYYEPAATKEKPRWFCPEVKFSEKFKNVVTLDAIKNDPSLANMLVIRKGQRLSVQPVEKKDFDRIKELAGN